MSEDFYADIWSAVLSEAMSLLMMGLVVGACIVMSKVSAALRVKGEPNEWVLVLRNGEMTQCGIGLNTYRRPYD